MVYQVTLPSAVQLDCQGARGRVLDFGARMLRRIRGGRRWRDPGLTFDSSIHETKPLSQLTRTHQEMPSVDKHAAI